MHPTADILEEASCLDCRNVKMLVGMRPDPVQGNFEFFKWDFLVNFNCFLVGFLVFFQWIFRAEKERSSNDLMCQIMQKS